MKHTKIVERPARSETVTDFIECDLCGNRIEKEVGYGVNEVTISHRKGDNYPEGGSGEEMSVDMCESCFTLKLIPWLREQGASNIAYTDWYW